MTLYIGQQHPITVYRTDFWVFVVLLLSVIRCSCYYYLYIILFHHYFHHDNCDYHWNVYGHSLLFELHFRLSLPKWFWFSKCTSPWRFPPLDILLEYWIEHVTFGLLYVMFTFPTRMFYRGVPCFANEWRLVPWIYHLPPVCWSTFWKSSLKW